MSKIDVLKENLKFQQLLKDESSIITLRDEYLIPDTHPDVQEVLMIEANPNIKSKEVNGSRITIEGDVEYNIVYIPREDMMTLNSVKYMDKFLTYLDIEEAEHKINCDINCKIEHIELKVMNERKIEIESILRIEWEIYKENEFQIVKGIESSSSVETLKISEPVNRLVESREAELVSKSVIRVGMDKPQIYKILSSSAMLHKKDVKIVDDKIQLSCYCTLKILYLATESKEVVLLEDDIYISKEEEIEELSSELLTHAFYNLENIDIIVEDDDLGEARIINTNFLVKAVVKIFTKEDIEVINDAYSTKFPIKLVKEKHDITLIHSMKSMESVIKDNLYIKEGDLIPERIQEITANIKIKEINILENKINIEGIISCTVLYKSSSQEKGHGMIYKDVPYNISLDINGLKSDMNTVIKCSLDAIEANIEANTIAVKATIITNIKVSYEVNKEFISDILETDEEIKNKTASVTIYVLGKEETLWSLAKKFNITVDDLIKINSIEDPEILGEGDKLIIPGRAIF